MFAIKQAFPLVELHVCAPPIAHIFQYLADRIDRTRATFVAERVPFIKIKGVGCVWNVCSDKTGYANWELHSSVGI